jgi:hypothetical protein
MSGTGLLQDPGLICAAAENCRDGAHIEGRGELDVLAKAATDQFLARDGRAEDHREVRHRGAKGVAGDPCLGG